MKRYKATFCSGGINLFDRYENTTQLITMDYGIDTETQERVIKRFNEWIDYEKLNVLQRVEVMNLLQKKKELEYINKYK